MSLIIPEAAQIPCEFIPHTETNRMQGLVLHVQVGRSSLAYMAADPSHGVVPNLWIGQNEGEFEQYLPLNVRSWCQSNGNSWGPSVETAGYPEEALTEWQLSTLAHVYRHGVDSAGWPLDLTDDASTNGRGFGWHGMGGKGWGNHPGCPGDARKDQRAEVLARVGGTAAPVAPAPAPGRAVEAWDAPAFPYTGNDRYGLITGPAELHGGYYGAEQRNVKLIQQRMQYLGYAESLAAEWADGIYEQPTADAVAAWQAVNMSGVTDYPGEVWGDDWAKMFRADNTPRW